MFARPDILIASLVTGVSIMVTCMLIDLPPTTGPQAVGAFVLLGIVYAATAALWFDVGRDRWRKS